MPRRRWRRRGGGYAARELRLNANTDDLVDPGKPFMQAYRAIIAEFGDPESMYAVIVNEEPGDRASSDRARAAVDALTARLRLIDELPAVFSGVEADEQLRIATRAMPLDDLRALAASAEGLALVRDSSSASALARQTTEMLRRLMEGGLTMPRAEQERRAASAILPLEIIASSPSDNSTDEMAPAGGLDALLQPSHDYFTSPSERFFFIEIQPVKDYGTLAVIEEPLRRVRAAIAETAREFPNIEIGLTGKPVLQADEMATTNRDMSRASAVGFVLVALAFVIVIGGVLRPALAVVAFACAIGWTYGAAALLVGQLNLLSVVFLLVLIGIGFDFGVHVIARYKEDLAEGAAPRAALRAAMITAGRGNITSALTSSSVFFAALATSFLGLRELGLIAGVGLLLCLVAMTFVLPALIVIVDRRRAAALAGPEIENSPRPAESRAAASGAMLRRPRLALALVATFTVALALAAGGLPRFEDNLLELQSRGLESVEWEHRILEDAASGSWFGAVVADDLAEVERLVARARQRPAIGAVRSVLDIIQPPSAERDALRAALQAANGGGADDREEGEGSAPPPVETGTLSAADLAAPAQALALLAAGATAGATASAPAEARQLNELSAALTSQSERLNAGGAAADALRAGIDARLNAARRSIAPILAGDRLPLRDALPAALRARSMSPAGRFLVMMHPRENVWELEPMRAFIEEMRAVDSRVTGSTISHYESMRDMKQAFALMAGLALLIVASLVWIDFRSVRDTALTMLPLLIGIAWTAALMSLCGISLNLANFFALPILLGVGVDSAVHIMHRYRELPAAAPPHEAGAARLGRRLGGRLRGGLGSTRRAVILTALTTMIGFGCLIIAQHRGLRSLGMVMALGSAACLIASMIVLPALLAWIEDRRARRAAHT